MKTYKKVDTILIPKERPSEMARDWQGGNKYPGIDAYSDLTLKKGQKIVQLVSADETKSPAMNSSGYYVLHEDYLRLGKNADEFCNALQVAAWENPDTKGCNFRPAVNVFEYTTQKTNSPLFGTVNYRLFIYPINNSSTNSQRK